MKNVGLAITIALLLIFAGCKSSSRLASVGCATCIFHMKHVRGCKLAVMLDGKPYLVEGSGIDDHGDANAADGRCNAERKASVEGTISHDRFMARRISVLDETGASAEK